MPHPDIPTVSSTDFVAVAAALVELFGSSPVNRVFERHNFSRHLLEGPPVQVSNAEYLGFMEACARETGQPLLGAVIGTRVPLEDLGPYGAYVMSASSLDQALTRASKAIKYHETGSRVDYIAQSECFQLRYQPATPKALGVRQQCDGVASLFVNLVISYEGEEWKPSKIMLPGATGARRQKLEAFFGTTVVAGGDSVEVFGPFRSGRFSGTARRIGGNLTSWRELRKMVESRPPTSFAESLLELMNPLVRDGCFRLEQVCDRVGITPRTLQRRLAAEGQNFNALLSNTRMAWAEELLRQPGLSLQEIGRKLGYSTRRHFTRAFKEWTGKTPGHFQ